MESIQITAHSGCEGTRPNSEEHLQAAAESGAEALEIDVRKYKGRLLLSHNPCQEGEEYLDLQSCFALVREQAPKMRVNCDIKEPGLEREVLQLAQQQGMQGKVIFTGTVEPGLLSQLPDWVSVSMNTENLLRPKGECFLPEEEDQLVQRAAAFGVESLNMSYRLFSQSLYEKARKQGISFSLWTVDDPEQMERLLNFELDNLTTRFPVQAVALRNRLMGQNR